MLKEAAAGGAYTVEEGEKDVNLTSKDMEVNFSSRPQQEDDDEMDGKGDKSDTMLDTVEETELMTAVLSEDIKIPDKVKILEEQKQADKKGMAAAMQQQK